MQALLKFQNEIKNVQIFPYNGASCSSDTMWRVKNFNYDQINKNNNDLFFRVIFIHFAWLVLNTHKLVELIQ